MARATSRTNVSIPRISSRPALSEGLEGGLAETRPWGLRPGRGRGVDHGHAGRWLEAVPELAAPIGMLSAERFDRMIALLKSRAEVGRSPVTRRRSRPGGDESHDGAARGCRYRREVSRFSSRSQRVISRITWFVTRSSIGYRSSNSGGMS